jgi:hypothetical protein
LFWFLIIWFFLSEISLYCPDWSWTLVFKWSSCLSLKSSWAYRCMHPSPDITCFICLFWGTGAWTQGLHLESLHQPFYVMGFFFFFWDKVSQTIFLGWLWTGILLISASWVGRITGVSHQCPVNRLFLITSNTLLKSNRAQFNSFDQILSVFNIYK